MLYACSTIELLLFKSSQVYINYYLYMYTISVRRRIRAAYIFVPILKIFQCIQSNKVSERERCRAELKWTWCAERIHFVSMRCVYIRRNTGGQKANTSIILCSCAKDKLGKTEHKSNWNNPIRAGADPDD